MSERPGPIDQLADLFDGPGAEDYLGERVSQSQHMCQAGTLAESAGAPDALVAAALLHDVGHFQGEVSGQDLMSGTDNHHSDTAAAWLSRWFPPGVTEPVRLHVAAKRYLCTVDPAYIGRLSPASVHTLRIQGGPMDDEQVRAFEAEPFHADAVALRHWDDAAKDPDALTHPFSHFRPVLSRLLAVG
jgi:phosphonate degradation associated HDIG domain protein